MATDALEATLTTMRGYLPFRCTHYKWIIYRTLSRFDLPKTADCGCRIIRWEPIT